MAKLQQRTWSNAVPSPAHLTVASGDSPHDKKRVPVPVSRRSTVRARQMDGLPRGDHGPPDGARLSLAVSGEQARAPALLLVELATARVRHAAQAAAAAVLEVAAVPGTCPWRGSPIRQDRVESPAEVAAAEGAAAEEVVGPLRRNCKPGWQARCSTGISRLDGRSGRMS